METSARKARRKPERHPAVVSHPPTPETPPATAVEPISGIPVATSKPEMPYAYVEGDGAVIGLYVAGRLVMAGPASPQAEAKMQGLALAAIAARENRINRP